MSEASEEGIVKRFLVPLLVVLALAVAAPAVSADAPTRVRSPFSDGSFSGVCSFTVDRQILVDRSHLTTFSDGRQMYTGAFKMRLINRTTGEYIDYNGSGPVFLTYNADGTITETDLGPQFVRPDGQLLLTSGPVIWTYDADFNVLGFTQTGGTTRDLCALLG